MRSKTGAPTLSYPVMLGVPDGLPNIASSVVLESPVGTEVGRIYGAAGDAVLDGAQWSVRFNDANNNLPRYILHVAHNTTGVPAAGIGAGIVLDAETSTTPDTAMAIIHAVWTTIDHADRKADLIFSVSWNLTIIEFLRLDGSALELLVAAGIAIRSRALILQTMTQPAGSEVFVNMDNAGDLTINALTGKTINFAINGVDVAGIGASGLTNKTSTLRLTNPAGTFDYVITAGAIVAERILNLPVLTGTDTIAVLSLAQTFTTGIKTFNSSILAVRNPANTFSYTIVASAIVAARNLTIPLLDADDTLAVLGLAQTFTPLQTFSAGIDTAARVRFTTSVDITGTQYEISQFSDRWKFNAPAGKTIGFLFNNVVAFLITETSILIPSGRQFGASDAVAPIGITVGRAALLTTGSAGSVIIPVANMSGAASDVARDALAGNIDGAIALDTGVAGRLYARQGAVWRFVLLA